LFCSLKQSCNVAQLTLNSQSSYLSLLSSRITGMNHHIWLINFLKQSRKSKRYALVVKTNKQTSHLLFFLLPYYINTHSFGER
jgi:hypothetical protein